MLITEGILVSCTEERTVVVAHLCAAGLRDSKKHNVDKSIVLLHTWKAQTRRVSSSGK